MVTAFPSLLVIVSAYKFKQLSSMHSHSHDHSSPPHIVLHLIFVGANNSSSLFVNHLQ